MNNLEIKKKRKELGFTQEELAKKLGVSLKTISNYEKGEVIRINKNTGKIVVKGVNFKFKHIKPRTENEIGEIKQFEAPIHHSNVKLSN